MIRLPLHLRTPSAAGYHGPMPHPPTRRRFIRDVAATAAGGVAAYSTASAIGPTAARGQTLPSPPTPEGEKVGFAVVGLGRFSTGQMLPSMKFTHFCKPAALVSGDPAKARRVAETYLVDPKHIYDYDNFDTIRDDDAVQVVYIALPTALHAEYSIRASEAGKHVLCEKPMAGSVEDCQRMIDAAKAAGKKLMIAYREQYEPYNARMVEIARSGELGAMRTISAEATMMLDKPEWRTDPELNGGGGPLFDLGIYALQACRYTTGEEPAEITAQSYRLPDDPRFPEGVETSIAWTMRFPSGVLATCLTGWDHGPSNRYRNVYTTGWAELDPATAYTGLNLFVGTEGEVKQVTDIKMANEFAAEMDHLAESIRDDKPVKTPGEEGLQDVRLINLIYEAARTGKAVRVPSGTRGTSTTRPAP